MWHVWECREEVYKIFVGKPEGKKDHLEDRGVDGRIGIRMDLREIGWGEWIQLTQDRGLVAESCEYHDEPSGSGATELVPVLRWSIVAKSWLVLKLRKDTKSFRY
jgi:hypothetical protein